MASKGRSSRRPNWKVSVPEAPDYELVASDAEDALRAAATFTRWDLERHGLSGPIMVTVTNAKSGEVAHTNVKASDASKA